MSKFILLAVLFFSFGAFAGFGGGRSGGGSSFSSGSRSSSSGSYSRSSSFGGSRAASGTVTYSKPSSSGSTASSRSAPAATHVYVNHNSGSSGPGFFTGLLMGNMMGNHTTVVAGQSGQVVESGGSGSGFWIFFWLVILCICGGIVWAVYRG